jgi:imidazole glycerol-phosphate synthase subunit HisH
MLTILDYGINNLSSVRKAVAFLGFEAQVQTNLAGASKLIIPGVGAFGKAMEHLLPLKEDIRAFAAAGNPVMGICLGQQLLFESSEELGEFEGLGLVPGRVRYLPPAPDIKVPNMGWSPIEFVKPTPLSNGFVDGSQVYFVHSLYTECADPADIAAVSTHGIQFPAAIHRGNIWGTQFHPEKSSAVGLRILQNFLEC